MIIEAGYDLWQLIHPELFADTESRRGLWMLAMDKNLRLSFIRKVSDEVEGSLEPHAQKILAALDAHYTPVRYFALAHMVPRVDFGIEQWVYEDDNLLERAASLEPEQYLGRLVFDEAYMYSSSPRYSFRDYMGRENLPRAAVIPGPHSVNCECLACTQFYDMLAENRARAENHSDAAGS